MEVLVSIFLGVLLVWFTTQPIVRFSALLGIGVKADQITELLPDSITFGLSGFTPQRVGYQYFRCLSQMLPATAVILWRIRLVVFENGN